jgi:hypothetical protein
VVEATRSPSDCRLERLTYVSIELHNTCATFLRTYYLSAASGTWLSTGQRVTTHHGFKDQREALTFAVRYVRKNEKGTGPWRRYQEPAWHDTGLFLKLINAAGCSNASGVNAAWSIGTDALAHLTKARHYLAHRNNETAIGLRRLSTSYGVQRPHEPEVLLTTRAPLRPQPILHDWVDDLETVFTLMPA